MMDFRIADTQRALCDEVRAFVAREVNHGAAQRDRAGEFDRDLWLQCGRAGLLALPIPQKYGGRGLDPMSCVLVFEELGRTSRDLGLILAIGAHTTACEFPLARFGSEDVRKRYMARLCGGELVGAHAVTEPSGGSNALAPRTRAIPDGEGFRIFGEKTLVTNAPVADVFIVLVSTAMDRSAGGGTSAVVIARDSPGLTCDAGTPTMGLRSVALGGLTLDSVWVPASAILGGVGAGALVFAEVMTWERVCLAAANVGVMEWLLGASADRARKLSSDGLAIGRHQSIAHTLADMKVRLEAARLLVYRAAQDLLFPRRGTLTAAIAKLFASEAIVANAHDAMRIHGGHGYTQELEIERVLRDSYGSLFYSGTSDIQRNIIAGWCFGL